MMALLDLLAATALLVWALRCVRDGAAQVGAARLRHWLLGGAPHTWQAALRGVVMAPAQPDVRTTAQQCAQAGERRLMPLTSAWCVLAGTELGLMLWGAALVLCPSWLGALLTVAGVWTYTRASQLPTRNRGRGRMLAGAGLMLLSLHWLQEAASRLMQSMVADTLVSGLLSDPGLTFLAALLMAWALGSSLLAMLVAATLAQAAELSVAAALPMVLGVVLGSGLLKLKAYRALALGHVLLRLAAVLPGAVLAVVLAAWLSEPVATAAVVMFLGALCSAAALCMAPLLAPVLERRCLRWFPRKAASATPQAMHLEGGRNVSASQGLASAVRAVALQADLVESMLGGLAPVMRDTDVQRLQALRAKDDEIDRLHSSVKYFLTGMPREQFTPQEQQRWNQIADFTISLEQAGDVIEHMLQDLVTRKFEKNRLLSPRSVASLEAIVQELHTSLRLAMSVFLHGRGSEARQLIAHKAAVRLSAQEAARDHLARLADEAAQGHDTSALYLDLLDDLRRINSHLCTVAYGVVHQVASSAPLAGKALAGGHRNG